MAFDFSKLARAGTISSITDPSTLFDALPNKADGYGYLRAVQKTVLDAWSPRRDERDLVLKTNTGGGKTIAGLLILQTCLNEKIAPALYVAPDPHLARRVRAEADKLGLHTVEDPTNGQFLSGQAIAVTTMQTLLNGKTRFGLVNNPTRQPVSVRAIVIDDAHAALAMTEQQTRLTIERDHPAWEKLVSLFEDELKAQSHNAFLDITEDVRSAVLRIPFWAWRDRQDHVLAILRAHRTDSTFEWAWPLLSNLIPLCQAIVTADAIEIVPPCPPIEMLPSFAEAERRIYLTATLADDSVLVTHFNADPDSIATSLVPDSAADLGDRLVLSPQELNPAIEHGDVRNLAIAMSEKYNVVVLVPSHRQAAMWQEQASPAASTAEQISDVVERLNGGHVGLAVIVNRYDGIDLPDEACRLLIIDGLPQAYTGYERREAVALRDSDAMITRQLQRIEQGMGRGVRSRDDRCVVLLIGPKLAQLVARADVADRFSPATRAQLELSRKVAADLADSDIMSMLDVIIQVVEGDAGFREISREALVGVTYGSTIVDPTAAPLRAAYNAAAVGRRETAKDKAQEAVNMAINAGDARLAGWLGETLADYTHALSATEAQAILTTAVERNSGVLRPVGGLAYKKVKATAGQSQQASDFLTSAYANGTELLLGINAVLSDLVWDNDRTNATEQALADLGEHLGFTAQRPERDFGRGSDVLWVVGPSSYAVIEAKSGATGDLIWKKDIDQLAGSVNWCLDEYGKNSRVLPLMMHRRVTVERSGTPPPDAKILNDTRLPELKQAITAFAAAIASSNAFRDSTQIATQLHHHKLTAATFAGAFTYSAKRQV